MFDPTSVLEPWFADENVGAQPGSLRGGPSALRAGQESAGEGFSLLLDFKHAFDFRVETAALGLSSPCDVRGFLRVPHCHKRGSHWGPACPCPCCVPGHTGQALVVEGDSGPHAGRAVEGGGGSDPPPSAAGELKQSVYHGKTALCSNSNGNFPE